MNGWYVEVLLLNREIIKFNMETREFSVLGKRQSRYLYELDYGDFDDWTVWGDQFIFNNDLIYENDTYSDLLDVERVYNKLFKDNTFTKDEIESLKYILQDNKSLNSNKTQTILKNFKSLCSKIAYFLGGRFTDEGYIEYLREKYDLDYDQVIKINNYIKSSYRLREVILG